jgi:hypothetical protein
MLNRRAVALNGVSPGLSYKFSALQGFYQASGISGIILSIPSGIVSSNGYAPNLSLTTNYVSKVSNASLTTNPVPGFAVTTDNYFVRLDTTGLQVTAYPSQARVGTNYKVLPNTNNLSLTSYNPSNSFGVGGFPVSLSLAKTFSGIVQTTNFWSNQKAAELKVKYSHEYDEEEYEDSRTNWLYVHIGKNNWLDIPTKNLTISKVGYSTRVSDNYLGYVPKASVSASTPAPTSIWTQNVFVKAITAALKVSSAASSHTTDHQFISPNKVGLTLSGGVLVKSTANYVGQLLPVGLQVTPQNFAGIISGGWYLANIDSAQISFISAGVSANLSGNYLGHVPNVGLGVIGHANVSKLSDNFIVRVTKNDLVIGGYSAVVLSQNSLVKPETALVKAQAFGGVVVSDHKVASLGTVELGVNSYLHSATISSNVLASLVATNLSLIPQVPGAALSENVLVSLMTKEVLTSTSAIELGWTYLADVPAEHLQVLGLNPTFDLIDSRSRIVLAYSGKVNENIQASKGSLNNANEDWVHERKSLFPTIGWEANANKDEVTQPGPIVSISPTPSTLKSGVVVSSSSSSGQNSVRVNSGAGKVNIRGTNRGSVRVK